MLPQFYVFIIFLRAIKRFPSKKQSDQYTVPVPAQSCSLLMIILTIIFIIIIIFIFIFII